MKGYPPVLQGDGLVLRAWIEADLPAMVTLFDDPEVDTWTPLESPFDLAAAGRYLDRARIRADTGEAWQWAVTENGATPLGEVLAFRSSKLEDDGVVELGYSLGREHRGRGLATRALGLALRAAQERALGTRYVLRIDHRNPASQAVARRCGFEPTGAELIRVEVKGRTAELLTWSLPSS